MLLLLLLFFYCCYFFFILLLLLLLVLVLVLVFYFTPCHAAWLTTNRPNTIGLSSAETARISRRTQAIFKISLQHCYVFIVALLLCC
jgi:hypothetical protein